MEIKDKYNAKIEQNDQETDDVNGKNHQEYSTQTKRRDGEDNTKLQREKAKLVQKKAVLIEYRAGKKTTHWLGRLPQVAEVVDIETPIVVVKPL